MGQRLSPSELKLYRATDEVLHYVWDPIGVAGTPQARDEYNGYLGRAYRLLTEGAAQTEIAEYLDTIESERMGTKPDHTRNMNIAAILQEWKRHVESKRGDTA